MDIAQKVERQEAINLDAVEARPVRVVVGHDRTNEDLQKEHPGDDEEVFADPPLAGGQWQEPGQHRVHRRLVGVVQIPLVDEDHGAEGEKREAEADPGPTESAGGRRVADQRLEWPILRPGCVGAGTPRHRRQRRVYQEVRCLLGAPLIEAVSLCPAFGKIMMRQKLRDLAAKRGDRCSQGIGDDGDRLGQVDPLKLGLHCRLDARPLLRGQIRQGFAALCPRDVVLGENGETREVGGRVILSEIRPHAVEAAVIHQIGFLKARLAGLNIGRGHQNRTARRDEAIGKRGRRFVGQLGRPAEDRETDNGNDEQDPFEDVAHGIFGWLIDPFCLQRHVLAPNLRPDFVATR
jgi:hypothetical protein